LKVEGALGWVGIVFRMLYYCIIPLVVSGKLGKNEKVEEGRRLMGKV